MKLNNDMYISCIIITHIEISGLNSKTTFHIGTLTESAARSNLVFLGAVYKFSHLLF